MTRPSSRHLSERSAYWLMAGVIGLALFASSIPSVLYRTYRMVWSMSPLLLTLVYAVYAFAVLATLLLAGSVPDRIGRRPVLLVALGSLMSAMGLFTLASSVEWLFLARILQGVATGLVLSAASAALLDLHPSRDTDSAGLHNGVAAAVGGGLAVLIPAAIFQLLPAPLVLPYVAALVLMGLAFVGTLMMAEPNPYRIGLAPGPRRPGVPPGVRPAFLLAALGAVSSWSIAGVVLALGPTLLGGLLHTHDAFVAGLGVAALDLAAGISQMGFRHAAPWAGAARGSVVLAVGLLGTVLAIALGLGAFYLLAIVIVGIGFGAVFLGALRALSGVISAPRRGSVMSAFYLVAYASLSVPAILAGALATPLGLNLTFEILAGAFAAVALAVALLAWRLRPKSPQLAFPSPKEAIG